MTEYYFLVSLLPPLEIGHVPALGFTELEELLRVNLKPEDWTKVIELRRQIDVENFRAYWAKQSMDPRGNLNQAEIEVALQEMMWSGAEDFPNYLTDFLTSYQTVEKRLGYFPSLLSQFFDYQEEHQTGFLKAFFEFQKRWRLVLLGFRAKAWQRDLVEELQFEDSSNMIVAEILAQKDTAVYEPPFEFKELKPLFEQYRDNPLELHRALYDYQFNYLIETWGGELFTIDRILNYMARLILVEKWLELDLQQGMNVIDQIERNVS